jgi:hypothetical protein
LKNSAFDVEIQFFSKINICVAFKYGFIQMEK